MTLRNGKVQNKKFKRTFEFSIKTLCRKWEWFFIFKQLENCQNEYYPDNLNLTNFCKRISLHVVMFPISLPKRICDHIENDKFLK